MTERGDLRLEERSVRAFLPVGGGRRRESGVGEGETPFALTTGLGEELVDGDGFTKLDGSSREGLGVAGVEHGVLTGETTFAGVGEDVLATAGLVLIGRLELRKRDVKEGDLREEARNRRTMGLAVSELRTSFRLPLRREGRSVTAPKEARETQRGEESNALELHPLIRQRPRRRPINLIQHPIQRRLFPPPPLRVRLDSFLPQHRTWHSPLILEPPLTQPLNRVTELGELSLALAPLVWLDALVGELRGDDVETFDRFGYRVEVPLHLLCYGGRFESAGVSGDGGGDAGGEDGGRCAGVGRRGKEAQGRRSRRFDVPVERLLLVGSVVVEVGGREMRRLMLLRVVFVRVAREVGKGRFVDRLGVRPRGLCDVPLLVHLSLFPYRPPFFLLGLG